MAPTMLCPTTPIAAKLVNKYIKLVFEVRKKLDEGSPNLQQGPVNSVNDTLLAIDLTNDNTVND